MTTFATRISDLIAALTAVIAPMATRDRARAAFLVLFCNSLDRMAQCFESLYQQWREGTLAQPTLAATPPPATAFARRQTAPGIALPSNAPRSPPATLRRGS